MFKTQEELRAFIEWAISKKVARVKVGTIEVEISALAFIDEAALKLPKDPLEELLATPESHISPSKTFLETVPATEQDKEDEDLLFHSSIP